MSLEHYGVISYDRTQISSPPLQVHRIPIDGTGGCLCQWPTDKSRSDCVHEHITERNANVRLTETQMERMEV